MRQWPTVSALVGAGFLLPLTQGGGVLARCHYPDAPSRSVQLPPALAEISGLAWLREGRILAHDDERGQLLLLDAEAGTITARWPLRGEPADDFEGVALSGDAVYLVTGGGRLYRTGLPASPGTLAYTVIATGLERHCEIEGLAWDRLSRVLLLPCKTIHRAGSLGLRIYRWDPARAALASPPVLELSSAELHAASGWKRFQPSSIEVDSVSRHLLLLSARQAGILELSPAGAVTGSRRLDRKHHRQPEGLTLTPRGDLLIADEAAGGAPRLSHYTCRS